MTAFIPGIGPAMIWVPTFIIQLISGEYFSAITILITGLVISIVIETLLFSKILGDKASIHPLMILIGILGGIPLFGIFGFIIGPLVLAYTVKILEQSLKSK
jgi:predicted PurR-regulated permease PerM